MLNRAIAVLMICCCCCGSSESVQTLCTISADVCESSRDACRPGSNCYTFKDCYEDVQLDAAAIQQCIAANPEGAVQWINVVCCTCHDPQYATSEFCDPHYEPYGHPNH